MPVFAVQVMMNSMIGAASKPNVTLSRQRGDLRHALHAPNTEHATWQLTLEPNGQAPFTPTSTSPSSIQDQSKRNKLGSYHCNNRVYSIGAGRWLSPDQAASPFWSLFDYVGNGAAQRTDLSGLDWYKPWTWLESEEQEQARKAAEEAERKHQAWLNEDSGCTICIHSNARYDGEMAEGHAWVTKWCDSWGAPSREKLKTYGTWGGVDESCGSNVPDGGSLRENGAEKGASKYGYGIGHNYECKKVTNRELLAFENTVEEYRQKKDEAWSLTNNCAGFASEAARAAGLGFHKNLPAPGNVSRGIDKNNGRNADADKDGRRPVGGASPKSKINPFGKTGEDWAGGLEKPPEGHTNPTSKESGAK